MHLLIIRLEMLTWKLLFRSVVVCHMCNICPFCCPTFQTEPQTPSTGTQTGAASMPSVTSLTVTWRGERNKFPVHPNTRLAWHYSFFFWSFMMCTALNTYCGFLHQFQASAGHQTAGPQDSVTTGVGGHASSTGEFESEPADVASPASSAASNFRLVLGLASWIRAWVLDRSTDSVVLLEWNGRTGEARNCRDVSLSCSRVTHHGSAPV